LASTSSFWLALFMAHVGGGFLYLAAHAVLGEMLKHGKELVLTSFSLGVAVIGILNVCLRILGS
jgi:zinc transporter ZupT